MTAGRNERAARAFLRSARLKIEDDLRAAALVSAAIELDERFTAATSRELRQLRAELAEYIAQTRRPKPEPEPAGETKAEPAVVTDIVERLRSRPRR